MGKKCRLSLTPVGMIIIQKTKNNKDSKDTEKGECSWKADENAN
jgi:hypothetical protein